MKLKNLLLLALTAILIPSLYAQKEKAENRMINKLNILNEPSIMHFDYDYKESQEAKNRPAFDNRILTAPFEIDSILTQLLQNVLDDAIIAYNLKGLSAALSAPNGDIWKGTSGISHDTVEITTDMLFGIASITKTFTATIIMQLYEADSLKLSDPIYNWLPPFDNIESTVTIRQLLNHTSGIYNYTDHPGYIDSVFVPGSRIWTPEEVLETFVLSPNFPPGTNYAYSNTNFILLGMIIEEITGNEVVSELHDRITTPLGLNSTFLFPDEGYEGVRSHVWYPYAGGDTLDVTQLVDTTAFSAAWTAGGILSIAEDLVKWSKGLNEGDILSDTTLALMKVPAPYSNGYYGLGTAIRYISQLPVYGHSGNYIYRSQLFYVPFDSLSISVLSNQALPSIVDVWNQLYYAYKNYISSLHCLPEGITFSSQPEIDNFAIDHPFCIEIGGDVIISGSDITNLDSLRGLKVINGDLEIHTNELLENLSGLDSLESINGSFKVYLNDVLTDFSGLENLLAIDGHLVIALNPLLNSLVGLQNIEPVSIDNLTITNNDNLSYCEVESICKYLVNTSGNVDIDDNAPGCNSREEVELACPITSIDEPYLSDKLLVFPNPVKDFATLTSEEITSIEIYDLTGSLILNQTGNSIDMSGMKKGIYFVIGFDKHNIPLYKGKVIKN